MNVYDGDGVERRKKNQGQDIHPYTQTLLPFSPTILNLTQDVNRRFILISEMLTHKETWLTELMNRDTISQL